MHSLTREHPVEHLIIRKLPPALARALQAETKRRGASLNETVIDLLSQALGVATGRPRSNGLARLAGGWSEEEFDQFQQALAITMQIDEEMWL